MCIRDRDGKVRICVPIAYETEKEILEESVRIGKSSVADIAEWRIDWYQDVFQPCLLYTSELSVPADSAVSHQRMCSCNSNDAFAARTKLSEGQQAFLQRGASNVNAGSHYYYSNDHYYKQYWPFNWNTA